MEDEEDGLGGVSCGASSGVAGADGGKGGGVVDVDGGTGVNGEGGGEGEVSSAAAALDWPRVTSENGTEG